MSGKQARESVEFKLYSPLVCPKEFGPPRFWRAVYRRAELRSTFRREWHWAPFLPRRASLRVGGFALARLIESNVVFGELDETAERVRELEVLHRAAVDLEQPRRAGHVGEELRAGDAFLRQNVEYSSTDPAGERDWDE